ncbi:MULTISPECIES: GNAT family N-acetyltransferase [unclassified Streptomyces]|uniref:GNAT family N-acetyltransferase n=1 Tax=unclassified Streptomyces TaxID=2593676 RepID=UPI0036E1B682
MSPTDATADTGTAPTPDVGGQTSPGAAGRPTPLDPGSADIDRDASWSTDSEDTLELRLPDEFLALIASETDHGSANGHGGRGAGGSDPVVGTRDDLLDRVADWGSVTTPVGVFHLVPVRVERDLPLIGRWMNDPVVARFWGLSGSPSLAERHVRAQLDGDGRSVPCLGVLDGTPMSYWEIYRADLDPLARHYPARPHDTGIHLLIGTAADRGRGLGSALLRAVADLALHKRPTCARVIAEPDIHNTPSVSAFLRAGFRHSGEIDLPDKRAALMIRDRPARLT